MMSRSAGLLLCIGFAFGSADAETVGQDERIGSAIRAAILGNREAIEKLAAEELSLEESSDPAPDDPVSGSMKVLAITTAKPTPDAKNIRRGLRRHPKSFTTRTSMKLVARDEPQSRLAETRSARNYERMRQIFNGVLVPVSGVFRGQFFGLLSLPFVAMEEAFIGRRYVTPIERELITIQRVIGGVESSKADRTMARRVNLSALQARRNADTARRDNREQAAAFWYDREMKLRNWEDARNPNYEAILQRDARAAAARRDALSVIDGDAQFFSAPEFAASQDLLRLLLKKSGRADFQTASQDFLATYPTSAAAGDVLLAQAALSLAADDRALAQLELAESARRAPASASGARAARYQIWWPFIPEAYFLRAADVESARTSGYILAAKDPAPDYRSQSPEEARQTRLLTVERLRGLFVIDTLNRLLLLPFYPKFSRRETLDAAANSEQQWLASGAGRVWLRSSYDAAMREKRYTIAQRYARTLGDTSAETRASERDATRLLKAAKVVESPAQKIRTLGRLVNQYPNSSRAAEAEGLLSHAREQDGAAAVLTLQEVRALSTLFAQAGLPISPMLHDGRSSNGEIDSLGLTLIEQGFLLYRDKSTKQSIKMAFNQAKYPFVIALVREYRQQQLVTAEIRRPTRQRTIPFAVDIGAVPGFDASPSLVPLREDRARAGLFD